MFDKDAFAAEVAKIAAEHAKDPAALDPAVLAKDVDDALAPRLQPALDRLDVLEDAVKNLADALASSNDPAAQVAAVTAVVNDVPPAPIPDPAAAGTAG